MSLGCQLTLAEPPLVRELGAFEWRIRICTLLASVLTACGIDERRPEVSTPNRVDEPVASTGADAGAPSNGEDPTPEPSTENPRSGLLDRVVDLEDRFQRAGEPECMTDDCANACAECPAPDHGRATCEDGACGIACDSSYHLCGTNCVSNADVATCGESCEPCPAAPEQGTVTCDGIRCVLECAEGYHRCGNECADDTSTDSCGERCDACPVPTNGSSACEQGACVAVCPPELTLCGADCLPIGAPCNGACPAGTHLCSGVCSPDTSISTCGLSCTPCPLPINGELVCESGSCGINCPAGTHRCGLECVSNTSDNSCGALCTPCGEGFGCMNGVCTRRPACGVGSVPLRPCLG